MTLLLMLVREQLANANVIAITVRRFLRIACPFVSLSSIVLLSLSRITAYDYPFGIFKRLRSVW
jgi:hypothetical protein